MLKSAVKPAPPPPAPSIAASALSSSNQLQQAATPWIDQGVDFLNRGFQRVIGSFRNQSPLVRALGQGLMVGIPAYLASRVAVPAYNWLTDQDVDPHRFGMAAAMGGAAIPAAMHAPQLLSRMQQAGPTMLEKFQALTRRNEGAA
jgi:hypothetical protein